LALNHRTLLVAVVTRLAAKGVTPNNSLRVNL
jgi:hypothetical protein